MVESACSAGDQGSIPGLERSPRRREWLPTQCSCLENSLSKASCLFVYKFILFFFIFRCTTQLSGSWFYNQGQAQGPRSESGFLTTVLPGNSLFLYFYWRIIDLQCCISFNCKAQWFSYTYTKCLFYTECLFYIMSILFLILFPYRSLQTIECSSLCYRVGLSSIYVLYVHMYTASFI